MERLRALAEILAVPAFIAFLGALVHNCRFGFRSFRQFTSSIIASVFVGVVVHLLLADSGFSESVQAGCVAMAGYMGGALLDAMQDRGIKVVGEGPVRGKSGEKGNEGD